MAGEGISECLALLRSSKVIIEQFQKSVTAPPSASAIPDNQPSPLGLLKASAHALKSTTTKLSLLTITSPFTPSAISTLLKSLHDSILPSLATSSLLVSAQIYPDAFAKDCSHLVNSTFVETRGFLDTIDRRAQDGSSNSDLADKEKQNVTESTGRVWSACDALIDFAVDDVPGFLVKKAEQWLALMKDAVQELQEWDPEELVDDDLLDEGLSDEEDTTKPLSQAKDDDEVAVAAGVKEQALRVLQRIPQSIHVLIKQRLAKLAQTDAVTIAQNKDTLDLIITHVRRISESIDESAEAIYMGNSELCLKKAGEARATAIDTIESVVRPWNPRNSGGESKEDTYVKRALLWLQQVDPGDLQQAKKS